MDKTIWSGKTKILLYISFLIGIIGSVLLPFTYSQTPQQNAVTALCSVISTVSFVLTILALMLFVLGGTLYAFAHFLPATGNFRGNMQGWGMGMLMGGIISLILYILAPFIITKVVSINPAGSTGYLGQPGLTGQVCTQTINGGTTSGGSPTIVSGTG